MKKINAVYVSLAALVIAIAALVVSLVKGGANVDVEEALYANPEIIVNAQAKYEKKKEEERIAENKKLLASFDKELYENAEDGFIGAKDGKIVMVEFFDFSCGYCHRVYPMLKNLVANNKDLKIVLKPLHFLAPISKYASKVCIAANEQGKFGEAYSAIFEIKDRLDEEKINKAVEALGLDMAKLKADMESEKNAKALEKISNLASQIRVGGVPTLILNNDFVYAVDEATMQKAINEARK